MFSQATARRRPSPALRRERPPLGTHGRRRPVVSNVSQMYKCLDTLHVRALHGRPKQAPAAIVIIPFYL
jgi:hypothetical protein